MSHSEIVSFLWGVADLIRDTFKRGKYQDVILPLTVLRRLDCVLAPTKQRVLKRQAELRGKGLEDLRAQLEAASGFAFYNTSRCDFDKLLADAPHLAVNLRNYIAGFSRNMREVLEKFDFDNTISKLDEGGLLFQVLERFKNVDLHPDKIDNPTMGMIFEELIRKFNEALNENPGEHFTPRDVVHLMVGLMLAGDENRMRRKGIVRTVYDPCCGSGGMLLITKEHVTAGWRRNGEIIRPPINPGAEIHLFGQEVNPETWAIARADLFMKEPTGRDAENIVFGSTLSNDRHAGRGFDYLIANPPYGKDWKRDEVAVRAEHERGAAANGSPATGGGRRRRQMFGASFDSTKAPLQNPFTRANKGSIKPADLRADRFWEFYAQRAEALRQRIGAATGRTITRELEVFRAGVVAEVYDEVPEGWDPEEPLEEAAS